MKARYEEYLFCGIDERSLALWAIYKVLQIGRIWQKIRYASSSIHVFFCGNLSSNDAPTRDVFLHAVCKYSNVHLRFPGLILPLSTPSFAFRANSLNGAWGTLYMSSSEKPNLSYKYPKSWGMQNDVTSVRRCWTSFSKKSGWRSEPRSSRVSAKGANHYTMSYPQLQLIFGVKVDDLWNW